MSGNAAVGGAAVGGWWMALAAGVVLGVSNPGTLRAQTGRPAPVAAAVAPPGPSAAPEAEPPAEAVGEHAAASPETPAVVPLPPARPRRAAAATAMRHAFRPKPRMSVPAESPAQAAAPVPPAPDTVVEALAPPLVGPAQRPASDPGPIVAATRGSLAVAAVTPAEAVATAPPSVADEPKDRRRSRVARLRERAGAMLFQAAAAGSPADAAPDAAAAGQTSSVPATLPGADEGAAHAPAGLHALVSRIAAEYGVPFALADAVIQIESRYTARIVHAGNYGLMQIRAGTARSLGYTGSASGLLDPETNLRLGLKYLAEAYRLGNGNTCLAIMRYQSGLRTTRLSAANRAYCARARSLSAGL